MKEEFSRLVSDFKSLPKSFHQILIVSLVVKLALAAILPLTSDEAYYWVWSHHMQLSFYDHPPFVAWLFWLAHPLENFGGAVRSAGVLLHQLTLCIWLVLLRPLLSNTQLKIWLWLALLSPLIGAGGLLITPDIPLLFFWVLTLLFFVLWLKRPDFTHSLALGLSCGLGLSSKYVMVLEPMFLFFASLVISDWRKAMKGGWHWILLGVLIGFAPVWIWNFENGLVSFRFQMEHGLGQSVWEPQWTYEYILVQIALLFPAVCYWAIRGTKKAPVWLWILAWGPLGFFALTSFKSYVEANWPIVAYAPVFALAAVWLTRPTIGYRATLALWSLALIAAFVLITTRWSPTGRPIKSKEFFEFDVLQPVAARYSPVFARTYQMASKLTFDLKKPVYKLRGMNREDFFDFLPQSVPTGDHFYLLAEKKDILPVAIAQAGYRIVSKTSLPPGDRFELWEVRK